MTGKWKAPALVWFRQDLRLADNPALTAAIERGYPVIPVYIWAPEEEGDWPGRGFQMVVGPLSGEFQRRP